MKAREEIARLQAAKLPRLTWEGILKSEDVFSPADEDALNTYFHRFAVPDGTCLCCGTTQGGIAGALMGGFRYGIAYGEGECGHCGWPGRADHRNFGPIKSMQVILQYHPDEVGLR